MKKLYVIRHAKSSWKDFSLADHERPLNKRGKRNISEMGEYLRANNHQIDLFVSSHAVRAFATAKGIGMFLDYDEKKIKVEPALYHAGSREILNVVKKTPNKFNSVAIFGHNPGFTSFLNQISNSNIENVPTCGLGVITFDLNKWEDLKFQSGKLALYTYPKAL